jgi:hypothetical protein
MIDYTDVETQRRVMLEYMQLMIARRDWHGVADAAMDLREMEAEKCFARNAKAKQKAKTKV